MPQLPPLPDWSGQPAYIIGGGKSLARFDFFQLIDRNVIGCNQAFLAHPEVIDITIFGDPGFWTRYCIALASFPGYVATNRDDLEQFGKLPSWLKVYKRLDEGLGSGEELAFNYNTGALAINLAFALNACPVYLLGFDMQPTGHWHGKAYEPAAQSHYDRFIDGFKALEAARCLLLSPPEVFNVSEGSSHLFVFPIVPYTSANLVAPTEVSDETPSHPPPPADVLHA